MSVDPVTIVIACLGLLVFLFLYKQQQKRVAGHVSQLAPSKQEEKPRGKKELQAFTREEVAKHCTRDDAWIIVQDKQTGVHKVYDVTPYVDEHPGGESILNNAGRDSTEGFLGPQHPATVFVLAEDFLIGTLAQQ